MTASTFYKNTKPLSELHKHHFQCMRVEIHALLVEIGDFQKSGKSRPANLQRWRRLVGPKGSVIDAAERCMTLVEKMIIMEETGSQH